MNRRQLLASTGLLFAPPSGAVSAAPGDEAALKSAIRDVYSVYSKDRDKARYRALLADDYLLLENGELMDADGDIATMPAPGAAYERTDKFDFKHVAVAGDVGYLVYVLESDIREASGRRSPRWLESAVFRRSGERWFLAVLHSTKISPPKPPAQDASAIEEVWRREAEYWRCVKTGDDESYVKLWHERFIGWPCGAEHPKRKAGIGAWVREVKEKRLKVEVDLTREGAEQFGDTVVVHYRFTRVDTYPDGHVEGKGKVSKITHTWMKTGGEWLIVGGMCGPVEDKAK